MAVSIDRLGWLEMFTDMRQPNTFLSSMFTFKRGGMYKGTEIQVDVKRSGRKIAAVVEKCTGANMNDVTVFTNKSFEPPSYAEGFPLDACQLLNRMAGVDPYSAEDIAHSSQLNSMMLEGFVEMDAMIIRSIELQASQILQTGLLALPNKDGTVVFNMDFHAKATHFPTVAIDWATSATCTPLDDIQSLAEVINADGKIGVDTLIMGSAAWRNFKAADQVTAELDNRRIFTGVVDPRLEGKGATRQGTYFIGDHEYTIWTYPELYDDPSTGNPVKFIEDDKVVMLSMSRDNGTRLDKASAAVPLIVQPDSRVAGMVPGRMQSRAEGFDVTPNVYPSTDNKQIKGELESRTLLIPTGIDQYGCLDTSP